MKIGIDCRLWNETGVGRYIRNLVLNLQKIDEKNEYVLFVLSRDEKNIKSLIHDSQFMIRVADIKWHTLEEQIKLPKILNRESLDLMHFPYFSVPIFYNRPYVMTIHDLIQSHYVSGKASTLPFFLYYLKRIGYKKVIGNAISKAKKIIVPLSCVKGDIVSTLRVPGDKIVVTPEGFDLNIEKGKVSENVLNAIKNPYFLYVGNAYPHKNLEKLLDAFNLFCHPELVSGSQLNRDSDLRQNDTKLILVGKEDVFYKRLEKEGIDNLIFLHNVLDQDLFYLYSHAVASVSASLMEGFGLFPLEALGAGGIVAVSNIPAFREACGDLAIYFNPTNEKDIAEKLMKALTLRPTEREEIKKKAEEWLKKFSWQKMAKETLKIYENAVLL